MRGLLHAYASGVAAICGVVLCSVAATRPGWAPFISCLIYSLTVVALFGTSALYHRRVWSPRGYQIMKRLDHCMIFIFIAGTYTPFSVLLLPPATSRASPSN
jgi:hemolysin III